MLSKKLAAIDKTRCVACGVCENTCPLGAVKVRRGCYAAVEKHVPVWTVENGIVHVKVGSVEHPMLPENVILKLMYVTAEQSLMQNLCLECFI